MSLRKSTSDGDYLSLSSNGERTPFRSLHNENLNDSRESLKVKSTSDSLKQAKENVLLCTAPTNDGPIEHHFFKQDDTPVLYETVSPGHIHSTESEELNTEHATSYCADVTLKSFVCDGGEVEISNEVVGKDDTIPLPQPELHEYPQHEHTIDSSNILNRTGCCNTEEEKADHAYCRRESGMTADSSMDIFHDKPGDALGDITLKCLNCTGGEIEIADSAHSVDTTIPLPADQNGDPAESYIDGAVSHIFPEKCDVDHVDHPYSTDVRMDHAHVTNQPSIHEDLKENELSNFEFQCKEALSALTLDDVADCSHGNIKADEAPVISEEKYSPKTLFNNIVLKLTNDDNGDDTSRKSIGKSESTQEHDTKDNMKLEEGALASPQHSSNDSHHKTVLTLHSDVKEKDATLTDVKEKDATLTDVKEKDATLTDVKEKDATLTDAKVHSSVQPHQGSSTGDSALGLSPNAPVFSEPLQAEPFPDVLKAITECTPRHLKFLTPIVRRASLACMQAQRALVAAPFLGEDGGLVGDLSIVLPKFDYEELGREHLDSPLPCPLFNSTELIDRSRACTIPEPPKDVTLRLPAVNSKPVMDVPGISEGPLQQQLRQMAEFLMFASGKLGPAPAPVAPPAKAEQYSACVGTTPLKMVSHSVNTSGQFERKRNISVEDQCTLTDPLLWNGAMDSLESVSRPELEQRVLSSRIIVEALVQQLAAARAQTLPPAGAAPSALRDKTVQTQHTELSQTSLHRDLYFEALSRIDELEIDDASLQNLVQYMQNVKISMDALSSDTGAALSQMKQMAEVVREDHNGLVSNYGQMKSLLQKSSGSQMRMLQKVKDVLQQKEDMRTKMEEAFSAKETAYRVMDQLRKHCSMEISELEKCVGSQQELLSALETATPKLFELNQTYSETLVFASELLSKSTEEQSSLAQELCSVRGLLQKCTPILLKLNEKTDSALRDRDQHVADLDQALQDKEQTEEDLNQAHHDLQAAKGQISDLNLQVTILTSEMGVLRQKLDEREEECSQLGRKATELSATVSSTFASYAFLEEALASETASLQQSWADIKEAKERGQELESSLGQSEQRVSDLSEALGCSEEQVCRLKSVSEAQALQLQQLQEMCSQLSGVREMNEFLQMENELSREQITESERLLRANLQSLRERNIQCEDLNGELRQLQDEKKNLQEELDCVKNKFTSSQSEHKDKLEQIVTEIALLHHTVRNGINELHASIKEEDRDKHIPSSSINSAVVALRTEEEESPKKDSEVQSEAQSELVLSEASAFTRITAVASKQSSSSEREEHQSNVSELLLGLDCTVSELRDTLTSRVQQKEALLKDRHLTIGRLQRELEAAHSSHQTQVSELQHQLSRTNARLEKVNTTLQQKTQDEKTVSKLVTDLSGIQEALDRHKADNNELRKDVLELRRSLQQSKSEAQFLRDELRKSRGDSAPPADFMEEKIELLKEVEKLKMSLQDEEQARKKLLDRAKRHQAIYETNQQKSQRELQLLDNMLNKVRETLLSLPEAVKNCEQLQQLMEFVG